MLPEAVLCHLAISHRINATAANGVPLGAEIKEKYFKQILLDIGLMSTSLRFVDVKDPTGKAVSYQ